MKTIKMPPPTWTQVVQMISIVIENHAKQSYFKQNEDSSPCKGVLEVLMDMAKAGDEAVKLEKENIKLKKLLEEKC